MSTPIKESELQSKARQIDEIMTYQNPAEVLFKLYQYASAETRTIMYLALLGKVCVDTQIQAHLNK